MYSKEKKLAEIRRTIQQFIIHIISMNKTVRRIEQSKRER